jgi:hypothetical protein
VAPEPVECGDRPAVGVARLDARRPGPDIQAHAMPSGTGAIPVRVNNDRAGLIGLESSPVARVEHNAGQRSHPLEPDGEQTRDRRVPPVMIPGSNRVAGRKPGRARRVPPLGGGHRDHQIAAHEPDRVLHAALLMTRIRVAETGLEPVNPAQNSENKRVRVTEPSLFPWPTPVALSNTGTFGTIPICMKTSISPWHTHSAVSPGNAVTWRTFEHGNKTTCLSSFCFVRGHHRNWAE